MTWHISVGVAPQCQHDAPPSSSTVRCFVLLVNSVVDEEALEASALSPSLMVRFLLRLDEEAEDVRPDSDGGGGGNIAPRGGGYGRDAEASFNCDMVRITTQ